MFGIDLGEVCPFVWKIIGGKDGGNRARRHASSAINALNWIDVQLWLCAEGWFILPRVNAIHGTGIYASGIFGSDAGLSNDVCHNRHPPRFSLGKVDTWSSD